MCVLTHLNCVDRLMFCITALLNLNSNFLLGVTPLFTVDFGREGSTETSHWNPR